MATEFVDYKRGPGFWFMFELLIAQDVCEHPILSAKYTDFKAKDEEEDMWEIFDSGLKTYERVNKLRSKEW